MVSDSLFDDVVRTGFCALRPDAFQAVKVTAKGAVFRGHILTDRAALAPAGGSGGGNDGSGGQGGEGPADDARVFDFPALAAR